MSAPYDDDTDEDDADIDIEIDTQEGRSAFAFLRWLQDNDIGVGLCHSDIILTPQEWATLIAEWENDDGESNPASLKKASPK